jgi:hypothetical protein
MSRHTGIRRIVSYTGGVERDIIIAVAALLVVPLLLWFLAYFVVTTALAVFALMLSVWGLLQTGRWEWRSPEWAERLSARFEPPL